MFVARLALLSAPLLATSAPTLADRADAPWRPAFAPRASDVVMRSLRPHPASADDPHDTLGAAGEFHATRLEWTYLGGHDVRGGPDFSRDFIAAAKRLGLLVGGASSGASQQVDHLVKQPLPAFCVLDLEEKLHVVPHKRGWQTPPGQGSVFSPEYFAAHLEHLAEQVRLGCDTVQRDETQMAVSVGFDFSPAAIAAFRTYLAQHSTAEQRRDWDIGAVEVFDVRRYFLSLHPPENRPNGWFAKWERTNPVKRHYDAFIAESVALFHRSTREALNRLAGRVVGFSCNNTSYQRWLAPHREFDWGMSELMLNTAEPVHMYQRVRAGRDLGKVQVFSTPKTAGQTLAPEQLRELNRRVIAQAYATGALGKVPWDLFMQSEDGRERYFGTAADYADLYGFVRALAPILEDFEEAAALGPGLDDRARWPEPPLRLTGAPEVYAYVRVRPRDPASPVAIHLVDWGASGGPATLSLRRSALPASAGRKARVLTPTRYDHQEHAWAELAQGNLLQPGERRGPQQASAYRRLRQERSLELSERGEWLEVSGLTAQPWSVVLIE